MPLFTQHMIGLAVTGDDLHAARLAIGPRAGRIIESRTFSGHLDKPDALREFVGSDATRARIAFVCDGGWCAARPMPISCAQWAGARAEVLQSLDRMLPYPGEQAAVGLVELRDPTDTARSAGGRLVATRRASVDPWLRAIERAIGRRPDVVLSPEMALLGLGLQAEAESNVVFQSGPASVVCRLLHGVPVAVAAHREGDESSAVTLPGVPADPTTARSGIDVAVAGALAEHVASEFFRPLDGAPPSRTLRWAPAVAAILLAGLALGAVGPVREARIERAIDRLQDRREALVEDFNALQRTRQQTERLQRLLGAYAGATGQWVSALPALRDAFEALPDESLLYRVQVRDGAIEMTGEAPAVRTVLERLTQNERIARAELTAPPTRSPADESLEVFSIRAERSSPGGRP